METLILAAVALGALCCMASNTVMIFVLMWKKPDKPVNVEAEKTPEEKERERLALEAQRMELEGLQNMMSHTGFPWKNGGKSQ